MTRRLYLDTARLGLMRAGARRLYQDFVRFAGEEGCTLYWDDFLRAGANAWPESLKARYPALTDWHGITHLKASLNRLAGAGAGSRVLLANRSAQLMKLAAKLLFRPCRNVLVTDLTWPPYRKTLERERNRTDKRLTLLRLRCSLLKYRITAEEMIDLLVDRFVCSGCDGLFLPAVDHTGIRLPVAYIVRAIKQQAEPRFVVVDGAQALAHVPLRLADNGCDFFIAGCHKWLGAHHPLGLGFFGHPRSADFISGTVHGLVRRRSVDDPLLRLTEQLENGNTYRYGETVNLGPMLSAQGAVNDCNPDCMSSALRSRLANAHRLLSRLAPERKSRTPSLPLRSAIILIQAGDRQRALPPAILRRLLHEQGIAATAYHRGFVRLSMPDTPWSADEIEHLGSRMRNL